jgi:transcriptional regulator with XRE-family HTH domain
VHSPSANSSLSVKRQLSLEIGTRVRTLREQKQFSQGDVEKRSGLLRHYISRVENGRTMPEVDTLQKLARALGVPLYRLFHDEDVPNSKMQLGGQVSGAELLSAGPDKDERFVRQLCQTLKSIDEAHRELLLHIAKKLAKMGAAAGHVEEKC